MHMARGAESFRSGGRIPGHAAEIGTHPTKPGKGRQQIQNAGDPGTVNQALMEAYGHLSLTYYKCNSLRRLIDISTALK